MCLIWLLIVLIVLIVLIGILKRKGIVENMVSDNTEFNKVVSFSHNPANFNRNLMNKNLEDTIIIFNKYNLFYWLSEGTALGALREQQIINKDTDIDIGISGADYEKFYNKCLPELIKIGFMVGRGGDSVEDKSLLSIYRYNRYIDIDITESGKNCAAAGELRTKKDPKGSCMKILNSLEPFSWAKINNIPYRIPSIRYIKKLYGNGWRTPAKNHGLDTEKS